MAPVTKLMRVAVGKLALVGAAVGGSEVAVGMDVELGGTCVGLARGVNACKVSATVVPTKFEDGMDVTVPPQAAVTKNKATRAVFNTACLLT